MKKMHFTLVLSALLVLAACAQDKNLADEKQANGKAKVYMTSEISPEALVKIYKALGREATGRVAVKISTGEGGNTHYLKPTLIRNLVEEVNGTIVECCTAYGGTRQDPKKHWETIHEHGFDSIFAVDLMDEFGEMRIPVKDQKHLRYNIVGEHLANYTFMINLAHFKGHAMGGFGGVLKNASIGVASTNGKAYIHSAGKTTDPVALDKACLDLVFNHKASDGDDEKPLIERINRQHGTYIVDYAEQIGLGTKNYELVNIDQ